MTDEREKSPPSHISHALIGPREHTPPPATLGSPMAPPRPSPKRGPRPPPAVTGRPPTSAYAETAAYLTAPEIASIPPVSLPATSLDVKILSESVESVGTAVREMHDRMHASAFVAKGDFEALRSTVQTLGTHVLSLTGAVRTLDTRRIEYERHRGERDTVQDNEIARLKVRKWIGGGAALAVVSFVLNHLEWIYQVVVHRGGR